MNDFRRTFLWVIFGISLILLWDQWQIHNGRQPTFFPGSTPPAVTASAPASTGVPAAAPAAGASAAAAQPAQAASAPAAGQNVTVTTDVYRLTFNTQGGSLVGAQLLQYPEASNDRNSPPIVLLENAGSHVYEAQTGLAGGTLPNHLTPMQLVGSVHNLADGQDSLQVRFESAPVGGVKLVKTYTLKRGSYAIGVQHSVVNVGTTAVSPQLYEQLVRDGSKAPGGNRFYSTFTGPAFYSSEGKYQKLTFEDIDKGKVTLQKDSSDGYVAMVQHYFASAWLPAAGTARENYVRKVDGLYAAGQVMGLGQIAPGATKSVDTTLFIGPQDEQVMKALSPNLDLVKDYGWLTIIARPLYALLTFLHGFLLNWGWSIVALVVLLKAAFYWLNHKAYSSMAKMKAINPRIQALRERHKDEPQKMQQEMMRIYREEKVNPLGGCLPIMIQIPVFIALYWVLLASVEMRGAPWILWVKDLSTPDPFYILPILMTLSSLLQVWLNPTPPDPMQAKMMWIMPLVFSVMFFFFPAGLVLYWLTNNLLSIAQQWIINRRLGVQ
ncbi:membrane protein insertase YidC [Brachymonas sp. M4Q-1]|uniref:membrane protein insertase YidC n=1 Tax=Brachymonas sp. M4Q-1 TaxID=3416906 RepID=UPI003CEE4978